ncbi:MAG: four helix bundle protein [Acidobacteriota bacterium]|jgi:four helix bundle protein
MNTTRSTPPPSTQNRSLTAHEMALEAAGTAVALALALPAPLRTLADQLVRCASSVPANLAEGAGRAGRDRQHHWRIAYASALEADSHLRLLLVTGAVDAAAAQSALDLFDRVRALTWRLIHPRR